ncbi:aldo-keto reductase family 1 member B1-like [Daphnia carinata]|uniref:aldo-keto reductase family 1 member B1-like n=1 Tax=Daphnia carinata TaxID=120202 RepID=UPI0025798DB2|nr:aldo-keto reductase family 1 member B1-like [Daphnia carinata]
MTIKIPNVRLNNGYEMPIMGFGTYSGKPEEFTRMISDAINAGYRHIDGAMFYGNEVDVGNAVRQKIEEKVVKREDLFLVSKLWPTFMSPHLVEPTLRQTLKDLQTDYLDLYLIHWPTAFEENMGLVPKGEDGKILFKTVDFVDTWKSMEACVRQGLVRSIGISNFNSQQISRLMSHCSIKPVTNQIEVHAYLNQKKLIEFCSQHAIIVTAYGPLGRPGFQKDDSEPVLILDPKVKELSAKYGRTPAQIALRYLTMQNLPVIPKSSTKSRIEENLASLEFDLSKEDMAILDGLDCGYRNNKWEWALKHPEYPFTLPF